MIKEKHKVTLLVAVSLFTLFIAITLTLALVQAIKLKSKYAVDIDLVKSYMHAALGDNRELQLFLEDAAKDPLLQTKLQGKNAWPLIKQALESNSEIEIFHEYNSIADLVNDHTINYEEFNLSWFSQIENYGYLRTYEKSSMVATLEDKSPDFDRTKINFLAKVYLAQAVRTQNKQAIKQVWKLGELHLTQSTWMALMVANSIFNSVLEISKLRPDLVESKTTGSYSGSQKLLHLMEKVRHISTIFTPLDTMKASLKTIDRSPILSCLVVNTQIASAFIVKPYIGKAYEDHFDVMKVFWENHKTACHAEGLKELWEGRDIIHLDKVSPQKYPFAPNSLYTWIPLYRVYIGELAYAVMI